MIDRLSGLKGTLSCRSRVDDHSDRARNLEARRLAGGFRVRLGETANLFIGQGRLEATSIGANVVFFCFEVEEQWCSNEPILHVGERN